MPEGHYQYWVILDAGPSVTPGMTRAPEARGHHTSGVRAEAEHTHYLCLSSPWPPPGPGNLWCGWGVMPGLVVIPVVMGSWHASTDQESGVRGAYRYFTTSSSCNITQNKLITTIQKIVDIANILAWHLQRNFWRKQRLPRHLQCERGQLNQWQANKRIWDPR